MDKEARINFFQEAYDMGYKHGYEIGKRDAEIEILEEEIAKLNAEA